ncbi:MAG TPA: hypothetical protein VM243_07105 [Phycisphaerae bacterium]|nr:hypothetical protein [Phycisphaerae bacterium]
MPTELPIPPPDPLGLPAPAAVFVVLMHVTFLLHVLFMNGTLGGMLIACELNAMALAGHRPSNRLARLLHQAIPVSTSMAITFGVAPLLFVQVLYGQFFYTAFALMGPTWLAALGALLVGFYAIYLIAYYGSNALLNKAGAWDDRPGRRLFISCIATVLLLGIAWVFTQNHVLSLHPNRWAMGDEWKIGRLFVGAPMSLPRYIHNVVGAVAVAGMWIVALGWWRRRRGLDQADTARFTIRLGLWIVTVLAGLQVVMGPVLLFSLDRGVRSEVFGFDTLGGAIWTVTLFTALPVQLAGAVQGIRQPLRGRWSLLAAGGMLVTVIGMVCAHEQVRVSYLAALEHAHAPGQTEPVVRTQPVAMIVFASCFVLALIVLPVILRWITRLPTTERAPASGTPEP